MRRGMSLLTVLGFVTLLAFVGQGPAQFMIKKDQPPLPLDAKQSGEAIEKLLKELDDNYVFPETARKMGEAIRQHVADKRYEALKTGQAMAQKLTEDLQAVSKDKHLRV